MKYVTIILHQRGFGWLAHVELKCCKVKELLDGRYELRVPDIARQALFATRTVKEFEILDGSAIVLGLDP